MSRSPGRARLALQFATFAISSQTVREIWWRTLRSNSVGHGTRRGIRHGRVRFTASQRVNRSALDGRTSAFTALLI